MYTKSTPFETFGGGMVSVSKRGSSWRATIFKVVDAKRLRTTATFQTKKDAMTWGIDAEREKPATEPKQGIAYDKTFGDLLKRYRDEVSVKKAGHRWERAIIDPFRFAMKLTTAACRRGHPDQRGC